MQARSLAIFLGAAALLFLALAAFITSGTWTIEIGHATRSLNKFAVPVRYLLNQPSAYSLNHWALTSRSQFSVEVCTDFETVLPAWAGCRYGEREESIVPVTLTVIPYVDINLVTALKRLREIHVSDEELNSRIASAAHGLAEVSNKQLRAANPETYAAYFGPPLFSKQWTFVLCLKHNLGLCRLFSYHERDYTIVLMVRPEDLKHWKRIFIASERELARWSR